MFYDDAQNLFGRVRPNWRAVGLNVSGRSAVMTRCFRNTRPVVEAAFNVLYGTFAPPRAPVPPRDFGNVPTTWKKPATSPATSPAARGTSASPRARARRRD